MQVCVGLCTGRTQPIACGCRFKRHGGQRRAAAKIGLGQVCSHLINEVQNCALGILAFAQHCARKGGKRFGALRNRRRRQLFLALGKVVIE